MVKKSSQQKKSETSLPVQKCPADNSKPVVNIVTKNVAPQEPPKKPEVELTPGEKKLLKQKEREKKEELELEERLKKLSEKTEKKKKKPKKQTDGEKNVSQAPIKTTSEFRVTFATAEDLATSKNSDERVESIVIENSQKANSNTMTQLDFGDIWDIPADASACPELSDESKDGHLTTQSFENTNYSQRGDNFGRDNRVYQKKDNDREFSNNQRNVRERRGNFSQQQDMTDRQRGNNAQYKNYRRGNDNFRYNPDRQMRTADSSGKYFGDSGNNNDNSRFDPQQRRNKQPDDYSSYLEKSRYDDNFRIFQKELKSKSRMQCRPIKEERDDLFASPKEYALAHCVAEDMSMGAGIAVTFRSMFRKVPELLDQRVKTGGIAILDNNERGFIYYLVTKSRSYGKPMMYTLWLSLQKLKEHMLENNVTKLAIPQLGCGLDRLYWPDVKYMIEYVFSDTEVDIVAYFLEKDEIPEGRDTAPRTLHRKAKVVNVLYPLRDIETQTALVYLGTENGYVSKEMSDLENKYQGLSTFYRNYAKNVGECIKWQMRGETLYGLIARKSEMDPFNYSLLEKCCQKLNQHLKKDGLYYVGLDAIIVDESDLTLAKIINVMQIVLYNYEIYICWPEDIRKYAPSNPAVSNSYTSSYNN